MFNAEDRLELTELVYRYGFVVDDQDWPALRDLFAEDAVFDVSAIGGPTHRGLDAIIEHLSSRTISTAHLFVNVVIGHDPDSATQPAALVRTKAMIPDREGHVVVMTVRYHARQVDGRWRFTALVCEGLLRPGPALQR